MGRSGKNRIYKRGVRKPDNLIIFKQKDRDYAMPYGDFVGSGVSQKMDVVCPKCCKAQEILWFPERSITYRVKGSTGASTLKNDKKVERVEGICECGYKFKPKDLDE